MKRKRGYSKQKPRNLKAVGCNKTSLNPVFANAEDNSDLGNSGNEGFDSKMDVETTGGVSALRCQNAALKDPLFIEQTNGDNQMHESNLLKNVTSCAAMLSKDVASSNPILCGNNIPLSTEKEPSLSHQDSQYNKKELNAALLVIKRIMKMDAANPFNVPVDPVALGIPDYFDVINTPMDFGTICNTLELGGKYRDSKDVYKDVELIWSNCSKHNKNGGHILELMERVKTNFMKHWNAACLHREQLETNNVHLDRPEYAMPHSKHGHACPAGSSISDSHFQREPDLAGLCHKKKKHHSSCYSHLNQHQQVFSQCQCQWNYRELQCSPNGRHTAADGHLHSPVHGLFSSSACNNCEHACASDLMSGNTNLQKQHQVCSCHNHRYQHSLLCAEKWQPHQTSHQCHSNLSNFRGTKPDVTRTRYAGHSHVDSPLESSMRLTKRRLEYPMASVTSNCSQQQQCQMDPSQLQSSSMIHSPSYQLQQKCRQCYLDSGLQDYSVSLDGANVGVTGHSYMAHPTESTIRHSTGRVESSVEPVTDDGHHEQECQMCPGESGSPSSGHSPSHEPKGNVHFSQPSSSPPPEPSAAAAKDNHHNGDSTGLVKKTRGRGPTRCLSLLREGKRMSIATNELGEPVGPEAPKFISYLGILARDGNMAPLTFADWRALPEVNKEKMWEEVQSKFAIDTLSKTWVLKSLGKKWKDWKAKLKTAHYISHSTDEERLADCDDRVLPDQWAYLVSHWSSEEAEKRSATNRANRAHQKFGHVTGTKSFARIREEERAKRPDGKVPSRTELFILTRTRKDGKPVNQASSAVITQLREIESKQQDTSKDASATDDVFSQIVGRDKRGRVRCSGLGHLPSEYEGKKPTHAEAMKIVSEANTEVQEMKERLAAMEQTCAQMAAQMATMMSMMPSMHKSLPDENVPNLVPNNSGASEARQVPNNSGASEALPLQQANSAPLRRSSRRGKV